MLGIELVSAGRLSGGYIGGQASVPVQVITRLNSAGGRPLGLIAPVSAYKDPALGGFMAIAAAHDKDADRWLAIHSIADVLEPVIEPALFESIEVNGRIRTKLRLSGVAPGASAMRPRPHDEPLQTFLRLPQRDVIQVRNLRAPGVVPTAEVIDGNVLVLGRVLHHVRARILPERVIVAVRHRLDQPFFIVRIEFQRGQPAPQGHALGILPHLFTECEQGSLGIRIARRRAAIRAANVEDPVHEAQLERAVMTYTVTSEIGHRVRRNHGCKKRRIGQGQGMLSSARIRGPHRSHPLVRPCLRADPLQRVVPVPTIVSEGPPLSF